MDLKSVVEGLVYASGVKDSGGEVRSKEVSDVRLKELSKGVKSRVVRGGDVVVERERRGLVFEEEGRVHL
jgi:hypothetical protein